MNILFFIASLNGGGAEKVMINIASYLPSKISRQLITIYDSVPAYDYHGELISLTSFSQSRLLRILKIPVAFIKYLVLFNEKDMGVCLSMLPLANFLQYMVFFGSQVAFSMELCGHDCVCNRIIRMRIK